MTQENSNKKSGSPVVENDKDSIIEGLREQLLVPGFRCECGSTNLSIMEDIGSDVSAWEDEEGISHISEERQHLQTCNHCKKERIIQEGMEDFSKPFLYYGKWDKSSGFIY